MRTTRKWAQGGEKGAAGGLGTCREVIGLTGPLLPVVSFPARLPTATIQFGSVLLLARTSGSLAAAGLTGGALAVGQVVCGPLVGRLADRHGRRAVVLGFSLADALAIAGLVAGALAGLATPVLALLGPAPGRRCRRSGRWPVPAWSRSPAGPAPATPRSAPRCPWRAPWTRSPSSWAPPWWASRR
ncbi:MFS transporter [Streptomyces chartreusis]|uniref:hypothetical protein n=1 Tax=Streptomyces chartreusis TaxID=1969 RepID=UPI0036324250